MLTTAHQGSPIGQVDCFLRTVNMAPEAIHHKLRRAKFDALSLHHVFDSSGVNDYEPQAST